MTNSTIRPFLLATAFALAGCGGGSDNVVSIPPPPVTPMPTPTPTPTSTYAIIPQAISTQEFAVAGASHSAAEDRMTQVGAGGQLQVRYVQSSNSYEVRVPQSTAWAGISYMSTPSNSLIDFGGDSAILWIRTDPSVGGGYSYSSLFEWADTKSTIEGHEAIGMATPASGVPISGSATYSGQILGQSNEPHGDDYPVEGTIALSFNFAAGSLSGSITPNLHQGFVSDPLAFRDTVYSTGSTSFSGKFDTSLAGLNSFSGLFTGPSAQELIGNFAFPYRSPIDDAVYQADGAFVGAR